MRCGKAENGTVEHERFLCDHDCSINHARSAGSMEIAGVLQCFKQSVHLHNLRYTNYIGDGDAKSYLEVVKADPYNGVPITKLESIGHVQKRVGSRLRTLKKECKDKIIVNGKSVALLQKLTLKRINTLQNYYSIAIRQSCKTKDISVMQKAIGAIRYHSSESNNPEARHQFCPTGTDSWWRFQADAANGMSGFVGKPGMPAYLREKLMPIFRDLSKPELLKKCTHGTAQNNNESINGYLWTKCPKEIFVEKLVLEVCVCSAVLNFNSGSFGIVEVLKDLGVSPGHFTNIYCLRKDESRIKNMNRKSTERTKLERKKRHAKRKGFQDSNLEKEGVTYESRSY